MTASLGRAVKRKGRMPACSRVEVIPETHLSPLNPLGVKGTGEGATGSAVAAVANAVADAMMPLRLRLTEVPVTPSLLHGLMDEAAHRPQKGEPCLRSATDGWGARSAQDG